MLRQMETVAARAGMVPEAMIGQIYASIVDAASIQGFVEALHRTYPSVAVLVFGQDMSGMTGNFLVQKGLSSTVERAYMTGMRLDDPYVVGQWSKAVGQIYEDHDVMPPDAPSELHRAILLSNAAFDGVVGAVTYRDSQRQHVLEVRFDKDDLHARRDAQHLLDVIVPHLVRATSMVRLRHLHPLEGASGDALLECVPVAAFALDASCAIRSRNDKGEAALRRMECIIIGADGVLHARDAAVDEQIKVFAAGAGSEFRSARRQVMTVRSSTGGRIFLSLYAVPPPDHRKTTPGFSIGDGWRSILMIDDASKPLDVEPDALWKGLGLTPSESELARSLLHGETLGDCAIQRHASKQSMRNLLLSIMRKTDTHRQTQLVSLLTRMALHART